MLPGLYLGTSVPSVGMVKYHAPICHTTLDQYIHKKSQSCVCVLHFYKCVHKILGNIEFLVGYFTGNILFRKCGVIKFLDTTHGF